MSAAWQDILATMVVQQLWQCALLLAMTAAALRRWPLAPGARSWIWLGVFALAALSPLAVLLPGEQAARVAQAMAIPAATAVDVVDPVSRRSPDAFAWSTAFRQALPFAWMAGFAWAILRLLAGWNAARRLRGGARRALELERLLGAECPARTTIAWSDAIASPMVVGPMRPCILVPCALGGTLPRGALLDLLRHECAHVRRGDLALNLAQRIATAMYWWNPLLHLIGRRLDLAREMACDEHAARHADGAAYARSLLAGVERRPDLAVHSAVLAHGVFGNRRQLSLRIEELLDMDMHPIRRGLRPSLTLAAGVFATSLGATLLLTPRLGHALPRGDAAQAATLVAAADDGNIDAVRALLRAGADVDAPLPGEGTALIVAARNGDLALVHALLELGATVDLPSPRDGNPLIMAAQGGHHEVVDALIEAGADVNAVVRFDETPLINASRGGHLDIVQCLVEKGADVNLGVRADFGLRSPLNQALTPAIHDYLLRMGARPDAV